jgi:UDP-N-acetylglucosamine 2-epimerase (non-hydrolysing)
VKRILGDVENIHIVEPLEYSSFVYMMMISSLIMTDSGGVQEEAPSLGVPVVLMRDTTERPELIENGMVVMAGTKAMDIYESSREILDMESGDAPSYSPGENPYGEGGASRKIVEFLKGRLS